MLKSMTGYGKAECLAGQDKYLVEIRSVNGKNADITFKTTIIPREKETEVRKYIADRLGRGNIDLFITVERAEGSAAKQISRDVLLGYYNQLKAAVKGSMLEYCDPDVMLGSIMRLPDVLETRSTELTPEEWSRLYDAIREAVANLDAFRSREGASLERDILSQVEKIESYIPQVERYERERISAIRERIEARMAELKLQPDVNRLEQEMIFWIEKLDINEEKVRLRQHCRYFRETVECEPLPGRKLGFIAQEMGREINTLGSKANHAEIQKWVVKMKDELEKIKEQSLNIL
ncbi:MAG: YicC family protein [Bacteroidales bacterium]|nr:YicC family protein [Bacteroidales bacterium]MBR0499683.1 YicC family protein [Bacteroidales bacterium]MBR6269661.1 YicC family protein [Bacteroidales bacterium]